jgi:putative aldouronate transport system substrate-binding protein
MDEGVKGRDMYVKGNYVIPQFPGVNMSKEERALYDKYWPNLKTYMNEMAQNWILGTKDVDKTWEEYQAYLKKSGYPQVIVSMQKAYDRQYGKK